MVDKYAIFGNPVEHSLSPIIHKAFAEQTQQELECIKIEPPVDAFESTLRQFIHDDGKGCNITVPFKHKAFLLADQSSDAAQDAKAASCLLIREDSSIYADNYDGAGLVQDLSHNHHYTLSQKKILILGAGGAVQGILGPLLDKAPSEIVIANRTAQKAIDLAQQYQLRGTVHGVGLEQLETKPYDLIIHATTLGYKEKVIALPDGLIKQHTWCYDLSYGDAAQPFLNWAKKQGAEQFLDGLGMLVEHNAALFYLWRTIYPDTKPIIELLQKQFKAK